MTKYDIDIMEVIWNNLTTKQKIDALQQAKNNICYTPNGMAVETWNVCTHYFKEKGLARAAHIEGGGVEAIQLTDLGLSLFDAIKQSQENNQSLKPKPQTDGAVLPDVLNTNEAKGLLDRLCKAGFAIIEDGGYRWIGTKYLCAYFADRASHFLNLSNTMDKEGNITTSWKPFEALFGIDGLKVAKQNWMRLNTKFEPTGFEAIAKIFEPER